MRNKLLPLLCLLFIAESSFVYGQTKVTEPVIEDMALLRVIYLFEQQATKDDETIILTDSMALDAGVNWSVYYDWNKARRDSLENAKDLELFNKLQSINVFTDDDDALQTRLESGRQTAMISDKGKGESSVVYKNRNTKEIITIDERVYQNDESSYFRVNEEIPPQDWTMTGDTLTILNYPCLRATTDFRGRSYTAWFTLDIPVNDGPWKFYGLPGLVLKVEDTEQLFRFQAIGLQNTDGVAISIKSDKKTNVCKLNQLAAYRASERKRITVSFFDGSNLTSYFTKNPVTFNQLEIKP